MTALEGSCHCGAVTYTFEGIPEAATMCNCTVCRRYAAIWAYDWVGERISVAGKTAAYQPGHALDFHYCPGCGCIAFWRSLRLEDGRCRIAVNLRLTDPDAIADVPIVHFDGPKTFHANARDGRCVRDLWY